MSRSGGRDRGGRSSKIPGDVSGGGSTKRIGDLIESVSAVIGGSGAGLCSAHES